MFWLDMEDRATEGMEDVEVRVDEEGREDVEDGTSDVEVDTVRVRVHVEEDVDGKLEDPPASPLPSSEVYMT